jgi:UDPglucose 6-dehydrogenase
MADALRPDRIVVGARDPATARRVLALYAGFTCPKLVVDPPTAEMIKYAANAFLAVRIALSNELANVCERQGIDWYQVAEGIGHDKRIGPLFLRAGAGFGGSCFPKDLAAIAHAAQAAGAPSSLLEATLAHNETQPLETVRMVEDELGSLKGRRIALLGLAFKPDTDDVRETRALPIHKALVAAGAKVVCHDPQGGANFVALEPTATLAKSAEEALRGADAAIIQTEWAEYRALAPAALKAWMKTPVVVDGRRTFDPAVMRKAGIRYRAIGLGRNDQ